MLRDVRSVVLLDNFPFFPSLLYGSYFEERRGEKNLPVLSFWVSFGKGERLKGRGMASKREEVVFFFFLPRGICCKQLRGQYNSLATEKSFRGGKSGGNRTGVNNLQRADAGVGRCAGGGGERERKDSRGGIWHKKKKLKKIHRMQA